MNPTGFFLAVRACYSESVAVYPNCRGLQQLSPVIRVVRRFVSERVSQPYLLAVGGNDGRMRRPFARHGCDPGNAFAGRNVMSTATTRRFASQLIAMNAGSSPSYDSQGSHVANVGDINVTVEGGGQALDMRWIATELRRDLRRGLSFAPRTAGVPEAITSSDMEYVTLVLTGRLLVCYPLGNLPLLARKGR